MMNWSNMESGGTGHPVIAVNAPSRAGLLDDLDQRLRAHTGFTLATLNLDHVVKLRRDPAFRNAYASHSHITADGNPIVWFSRLSGQEVELVPGSELVAPVAGIAARLDVPVALFGSTPASLDAAAQALVRDNAGLHIVARLSPPMGFDPTGPAADAAIAELKASGARLVFLALGAPKQEIFAARAAQAMSQAGFLSIGAGLDFLSGQQTRAPKIVRKFAAEWLWRLASNPRRMAARYGACIAILPRLTTTALKSRTASAGRATS